MKDNTNKDKVASFFSPPQKQIVAAGFTAFCAALVIAFVSCLLWAFCKLLAAVSVVVTPLLVAVILTVIFKPFYQWLYTRLWKVHALALIVFFISLLVPIVLMGSVFGSLMVKQLSALIDNLPTLVDRASAFLEDKLPELAEAGLGQQVKDALSAERLSALVQSMFASGGVGGTALSYGISSVKYLVSLVGWLIVPVYLIYFLVTKPFQGENVKAYLPFLKEGTRDDVAYLIDEFLRIISAFFRGQLVIAMIQGALYGVGFWLVGLPYGMMLGLCLGFLNIIPYLGSIIGLSVTLPLAFFGDGGGLTLLCLVLTVFVVVQVFDGYFLTPKIMGKQTGLDDVTVIFSLLFWGVVFGSIMGILLAIPLSAFVVVFWRLLKTKYIREWV